MKVLFKSAYKGSIFPTDFHNNIEIASMNADAAELEECLFFLSRVSPTLRESESTALQCSTSIRVLLFFKLPGEFRVQP